MPERKHNTIMPFLISPNPNIKDKNIILLDRKLTGLCVCWGLF